MAKLLLTTLAIFCSCGMSPVDYTCGNQTPFIVEPYSKVIPLPFGLESKIGKGKVVFHFFIDSSGECTWINIAYLTLFDRTGNQIFRETMPSIEVVTKSEYPANIQRYFDYLMAFAEQSKIVRVGESEKGRKYLYRLPLDIGSE